MKCKNYKTILDKWQEENASFKELKDLEIHISECSSCMEKYNSINQVKKVSKLLQNNRPEFIGKEKLIENIFSNLPEKKNFNNETTNIIFSQKFKLAMLSMAAGLIVFFMVQQGNDIVKIKQLEAQNRITMEVDYNPIIVKAGLILKFSNKNIVNSYLEKFHDRYKIDINKIDINKILIQKTGLFRFLSKHRMTTLELEILLNNQIIHKKNRSYENDTL
ncbi:MAG: hypothetical protein ABFS35_16290 [Bacteroidota bacterium]